MAIGEEERESAHRKDVHGYPQHAIMADSTDVAGSGRVDDESRLDDFKLSKSSKNLDGVENSIESAYMNIEVPPWKEQITVRGVVVATILGSVFCIITHKLSLTVGIIPSLNVAAGLLGFFFIKLWTTLLSKLGIFSKPFTRQENTVIQTCVVSCYGLAFSGGFGTYLLAMDKQSFLNTGGTTTVGNRVQDIKTPDLSWFYGFIFVVSFIGIFSLVPLRKIMIIDYKLTYPSGTATATLINSFHTKAGAGVAKKQVQALGKYFTISFAWSFFKWFFSGIGDSCGFDNFPGLGLKAYSNRFYFDSSLTYIGVGLICPHIVNISVMLGAIVSWGLMWPLIKDRAGDWYPKGLRTTDFRGLYGYQVFISIALILGDGLYNFGKITFVTLKMMYIQRKNRQLLPTSVNGEKAEDEISPDEARRNEIFMKDGVPTWFAASGYVALAAISIGVMPQIFPPLKWYFILCAYIVAPVLAFCNAYGCGLTDWSLASTYGKLGLFIFASWAGSSNGGVIAGLAACGVMMSIVATAADLMQDFKTGYLTLSSPRSMFISQLIGAVLGCIIAPATFWLFYSAFEIGVPGSQYAAPFSTIYRAMAIIGVEGFGALPKHCLQLCAGFFFFAMVVNFCRDCLPKSRSKYIPIPMAMAIPFYIGAYFAIDMFIGTCILYAWQRINRKKADTYAAAVASGLICGDGIWSVPSAILALSKVNPPLCMFFFSAKNPFVQSNGYQ